MKETYTLFEDLITLGDMEFAERELSTFTKIYSMDYKNRIFVGGSSTNEMLGRLSHFSKIGDIPTFQARLESLLDDVKFIQRFSMKKRNEYLTHGFYPYKGKFYPRLAKCALNLINVKEGDLVLDPLCGSGTLNVEANMLGIDSIGVDINPLFTFVTQTKCDILRGDTKYLERLAHYYALKESKRKNKSYKNIYPQIVSGMLEASSIIADFIKQNNIKVGKTRTYTISFTKLPFKDGSIDGIVTSPPYSTVLDYVEDHRICLEEMSVDCSELREKTMGLRNKKNLESFYEDLRCGVQEMYRVLKPNAKCIIVIGNNSYQGKFRRHDLKCLEFAKKAGFKHEYTINNPLFGAHSRIVFYEHVQVFSKPQDSAK